MEKIWCCLSFMLLLLLLSFLNSLVVQLLRFFSKKKMTTAFPLTTGGVTAAAGTPIGVSSPGTLLDSRMLLVQSQNMALRLLVAEKHRSVKRLDAEISLARKEHQKLATSFQELRTLGRVLKRYLTSLVSSAPLF